MDRRQSLEFGNTNQLVEMIRPDWTEGAITGGMTAKVWRGSQGNNEAPILTPTVTVDSVNLALSAASGQSQTNRKRINLASTTGLNVGRSCYLQNALGQREIVKLAAISANAYADAEYDLAYDYPQTTSTLNGIRATFPIDATFITTEGNINLPSFLTRYPNMFLQDGLNVVDPATPYRVYWAYTLNGTQRAHWTYFDVVRVPKQHGVTPLDLAERFPDMFFSEPKAQRGQKFQTFIDLGWRRVQFDMTMRGVRPDQIAEGQFVDELVIAAAVSAMADASIYTPKGVSNDQFRRERAAIYRRDFEAAMTGPHLQVAQNQDGSITPDPIAPIWFK